MLVPDCDADAMLLATVPLCNVTDDGSDAAVAGVAMVILDNGTLPLPLVAFLLCPPSPSCHIFGVDDNGRDSSLSLSLLSSLPLP